MTIRGLHLILRYHVLMHLILHFTNGSTSTSEISSVDPRQPHGHWFFQFAYNIFGYFVLMLPGAILVYAVKSKSCLPRIACSPLVRIFVYGKESIPAYQDIEQLRESSDSSDNEDLNGQLLNSHREYHQRATNNSSKRTKIFQLIYCFVGLQISYLTWGILQEKIMTTTYKDSSLSHDIHFHDSQFLVLINRILAFIIASSVLFIQKFILKRRHKTKGQVIPKKIVVNSRTGRISHIYEVAPLYLFSFCSVTNILSSWCQYEALKYVNFPTQVLSKACKLLPVMLMSRIVSGKKYRPVEYVIAVVVSIGMCLFLMSSYDSTHMDSRSSHPLLSYSLLDGLVILSLYLSFDSFTSNWQERLTHHYQVSSLQMMSFVNLFSILFTLMSLAQQRSLMPTIELTLSSNQLTKDCLLLSLCSATGQLFIFHTISVFGALTFTFMMTLRQTFAIILSCLIYGHLMTWTSILGVAIVFSGLFGQIYLKDKLSHQLKSPMTSTTVTSNRKG